MGVRVPPSAPGRDWRKRLGTPVSRPARAVLRTAHVVTPPAPHGAYGWQRRPSLAVAHLREREHESQPREIAPLDCAKDRRCRGMVVTIPRCIVDWSELAWACSGRPHGAQHMVRRTAGVLNPVEGEIAEPESCKPLPDHWTSASTGASSPASRWKRVCRWSSGKSSSTRISRPPGRSTRRTSARPWRRSSQWWKALIERTSVAQPFGTGSRSAAPRRTCTVRPRPTVRSAVASRKGKAGSTPTTCTAGAAAAASATESPGPQPMSTTRSPARTPARSITIRFRGSV